jgi:hypothetical protein
MKATESATGTSRRYPALKVSIVWPSSRLPPCGPGHIQTRRERKAALLQQKSPPVRMENANRKGFVREGKAMEEPKPASRSGLAKLVRLDT